MSVSLNPLSAPADLPLFPSSTSPTSTSTSGVGLGYGIAITVGILVLISTITLASYICVRIKSYSVNYGGAHRPTTVPSPSIPAGPTVLVVGLDRAAIDAFYPKLAYGRCGGAGSVECAICLAEYAEGDPMRRAPECGHCFHAACLDQWLRTSATCPVCRSSPLPTPLATPLSELIPLAFHPR